MFSFQKWCISSFRYQSKAYQIVFFLFYSIFIFKNFETKKFISLWKTFFKTIIIWIMDFNDHHQHRQQCHKKSSMCLSCCCQNDWVVDSFKKRRESLSYKYKTPPDDYLIWPLTKKKMNERTNEESWHYLHKILIPSLTHTLFFATLYTNFE